MRAWPETPSCAVTTGTISAPSFHRGQVLELGCGSGDLLAALSPSRGVGLDVDPHAIAAGRARGLPLELQVGNVEDESILAAVKEPFDYILLADTLAELDDCEAMLARLHRLCHRGTRLVIIHHSPLWEPALRLAERLRLKAHQPDLNWFTSGDVETLCRLADFEVVSVDCRQLCPLRLLGVGSSINRLFERLPLVRLLGLRRYVVARSLRRRRMEKAPSLTVVIPCRNERDNVEAAVLRIPTMCPDQEILFVEGHSEDGTWQEIQRVQQSRPECRIRSLHQPGVGKADAVWAAFDVAQGDLLIILDGDLTVPPESLPSSTAP